MVPSLLRGPIPVDHLLQWKTFAEQFVICKLDWRWVGRRRCRIRYIYFTFDIGIDIYYTGILAFAIPVALYNLTDLCVLILDTLIQMSSFFPSRSFGVKLTLKLKIPAHF